MKTTPLYISWCRRFQMVDKSHCKEKPQADVRVFTVGQEVRGSANDLTVNGIHNRCSLVQHAVASMFVALSTHWSASGGAKIDDGGRLRGGFRLAAICF